MSSPIKITDPISGSTQDVNQVAYPYLEIDSITRLPIPSLEQTLAKYITTVEAILLHNKDRNGVEDLNKTKQVAQKFLRDPQQGPLLHLELQQLAKETPTSWLEGWWDTMYLEIRDPSPINVNPAFGLEDDPSRKTPGSRAAGLIYASLNFFLKIKNGQLNPDKEKDTSLCMCQYGRLFGTTRIPKWKRDVLLTYPQSRHVIIMHRGNFYPLEVLVESQGQLQPLPEPVIRSAIEKILASSKRVPPEPPVGILTSEERNTWAALRGSLESHSPVNVQSLKTIDSSLFVVCIDDDKTATLEDLSRELLHSDGTNRWFDKAIEIIVNANGSAGINMEHSGFDGHTMISYLYEMHMDCIKNKDRAAGALPSSNFKPERLQFKLPRDVFEGIEQAKKKFAAFAKTTHTTLLVFDGFGRDYIIDQLKLSPDGLVQMAFQLTYQRLFGKPGSAYESSLTKRFYHGRTECLRSVSNDSVAFCNTFLDPKSDNKDKEAALRRAIKTHVKLMEDAKNGNGVDRHLWGMMHLALQRQARIPGYKVPELYSDRSWSFMRTDLLSTSNCGNNALTLFGFGPVVPEGFGLGYIIKKNSITVNVTSFILNEDRRFAKALNQSFRDIAALIESNKQGQIPKAKL